MIKKIIYYLAKYIYANLNHLSYARLIGVKIRGKNVKIYGNPIKMFGTEPWCIELGENNYITDEVLFVTHDGATLIFRNRIKDLEITGKITLGDNVYIGTRSIILPNVRIGNNCIIAAGSVVTRDVPNNTVVGGNPAKKIENIEEYLEKAQRKSLHVGNLKGKEKDKMLKEILK